MFSLYRRLLSLRRTEPALSAGDYETLSVDEHVFTYVRSAGGRRLIVSLNFSEEQRSITDVGETLLSTCATTSIGSDLLLPNEGRISVA